MHILILNTHQLHAQFLRKALRYENIGADLCQPENLKKIWYGQYEGILFPAIEIEEIRFKETLETLADLGKIPIFILTRNKITEALHVKIQAKLHHPEVFPLETPFKKILRRLLDRLEPPPHTLEQKESLSNGDLEINLERHEVKRGKRLITLRNKEYALLLCLMKNQGKALTRTYLLEAVWDRNTSILSNTVDVHINRLRRKIDDDPTRALIQTIPCVGYSLTTSQ